MTDQDNIHMMEQGSDEWHQYKAGKLSASHASDVTAGGAGTTRNNYMIRLALERLTGNPAGTFTSHDMQVGIEREPLARDAYSFFNRVEVDQVGFIDHPEINGYGCSPDGLIGEDGMVEIKCPKPYTHHKSIQGHQANKSPKEILGNSYYKQVQAQMGCAERDWVDWVSFNPEFPEDKQLVVVRVPRDEAEITKQDNAVLQFIEEMIDLIAEIDEYSYKPNPNNIYQRPSEVVPNKIDGEEIVWPTEDVPEKVQMGASEVLVAPEPEFESADTQGDNIEVLPGIPNESGVVDNVRAQSKPKPQQALDTLF